MSKYDLSTSPFGVTHSLCILYHQCNDKYTLPSARRVKVNDDARLSDGGGAAYSRCLVPEKVHTISARALNRAGGIRVCGSMFVCITMDAGVYTRHVLFVSVRASKWDKYSEPTPLQ
ncbi:hypothetical protein EVAR_8916_1 [Eumeta japonica]|uniref:Uncharacterized protein n=1 Tax=Eumeta variegata TaxID=151549 RepID=A0A4C1U1Q1_EUMVA|nr:hypothetical protein EVAR_8916_1 [Eumeta japonica]